MTSFYNERFLSHEHADVTFLKQDEIGLVLSRALGETFKAQPSKPIEFFAKYLLNHSKTYKHAQAEKEREQYAKDLKQKHTYFVKQKNAEMQELAKIDKQKQDKIKKFYDMLEKSEDLSDNLDELAVFLQEFTGSTGVYIGKLVKPRREINEDDDDKAHIDEESPKVIWYIHSSDKAHEFIKGKILKNDQGITHGVFYPPSNNGQVQEQNEEDDEGAQVREVKVKSEDILANQHHLYVKEVVREPKMHFYKVPRLGSYLAIPLCYNSCLFEDALDNAVADYFTVQKAREEQEKHRHDFEDEQNKIREEKERQGEAYEAEIREWPLIQEKPFDTFEEQYVVCLDTMGQDREFSQEERRFAVQTVINFKDIWERTEFENLTRDRNRKIEFMEIDREFLDNESQKLMEEEDKHVEEMINQHIAEGGAPVDDEMKDLINKQIRLNFIAKQFRDRPDMLKNINALRQFKVLKMPRVIQSIFYFMQYSREDICEKGTNKFFWKKAKNFLNDEFLDRLANFNALGPKEEYLPRYTTINFVEKNIEGISTEEVDAYHLTLGKLFKWMLLAIKTRKEDIIRRKALKRKAREQREDLIEQSRKREDKFTNDLRDAQQKFLDDHKEDFEAYHRYQQEIQEKGQDYGEEDGHANEANKGEAPVLPAFNEAQWQEQWKIENPQIIIPDPIIEEKDNDWYMIQEEEDALIANYLHSREVVPGQPPK